MKELIRLAWWLIEAKILYYYYEDIETSRPSDYEYDIRERQYKELCLKYKVENTVENMVGIDLERPSVQSAINRLRGNGFKMMSIGRGLDDLNRDC